MTDVVIRRAGGADLAAIVQLRHEWTREEDGEIEDPDFEENLAAWYGREWSRRIMWLAADGGRPSGHTAIGASALSWSVRRLPTRTTTASPGSC
jgi:hypothetical protein